MALGLKVPTLTGVELFSAILGISAEMAIWGGIRWAPAYARLARNYSGLGRKNFKLRYYPSDYVAEFNGWSIPILMDGAFPWRENALAATASAASGSAQQVGRGFRFPTDHERRDRHGSGDRPAARGWLSGSP